eukprot:4270332-Amphidinium_carterae.1
MSSSVDSPKSRLLGWVSKSIAMSGLRPSVGVLDSVFVEQPGRTCLARSQPYQGRRDIVFVEGSTVLLGGWFCKSECQQS